jgi:hypothetical protein
MIDDENGLFGEAKKPTPEIGYALYNKGKAFNSAINLNDTVRVNENFYIGKQWEGVQSNGLPTPQFNFLKRVTGFIVATITTDNIKVTASALASTPNTSQLVEPVRIVNEEFEALTERNRVPSMLREFARNAAVDGDGCIYTYWDADEKNSKDSKGAIKSEIIENTRVFFGNPNDRNVQSQPWIIISNREIVRRARRKAKANGFKEWQAITSDTDDRDIDSVKTVEDDKVTVFLLMWKDDETGKVWAYEFTQNCGVKDAWDTGLTLYPIVWLPWDYVQDCYHGQAMITGLIPNQIFVNKMWAMSMLSMMRTAYPKYIYDSTRIKKLDNRVGAAIGVPGGDISNAVKTIDPATISPQVSQYIELAIKQTEESLGATSVALGDTRPDNTSAIIALQRAASTPTEMTKQCLYQGVEDLFRIYLDFMSEYYGKRMVDMETPPQVQQAFEFAGQQAPEEVPMEFDFSTLKEHPMMLKLDVGASSYYSEIASMQTLDNLLMNKHISIVQYLERIPDGYIPARRALISEILNSQQAAAPQAMPGIPAGAPGGMPEGSANIETGQKPDIPTGGGFGALQRKVLQQGTTEGLV